MRAVSITVSPTKTARLREPTAAEPGLSGAKRVAVAYAAVIATTNHAKLSGRSTSANEQAMAKSVNELGRRARDRASRGAQGGDTEIAPSPASRRMTPARTYPPTRMDAPQPHRRTDTYRTVESHANTGDEPVGESPPAIASVQTATPGRRASPAWQPPIPPGKSGEFSDEEAPTEYFAGAAMLAETRPLPDDPPAAPEPTVNAPRPAPAEVGVAAPSTVIATVTGTYLDAPPGALGAVIRGGPALQLGRSDGSPLFDDTYVDVNHATLVAAAGGVTLDGFGSPNGVFTRVLAPIELVDGDMFLLGQELLRFSRLVGRMMGPDSLQSIGSPDPGYWGRVDVMLSPRELAASYPIDEPAIVIGREAGDLVFPDDPFVSHEHCRLSGDKRQATLDDLGSANGTWIRVRWGDLIPYGAEIMVGHTLLRIDGAAL